MAKTQRLGGWLVGLLLVAALGCADKQVQPKLPKQVDACAAVATLYPKDRLRDESVLKQLVGRQWSLRDGGVGSMHGPPMKWRRSTDVTFEVVDNAVRVQYQSKYESTGESPEIDSWTKQCQVCGPLLACGDELVTFGVREFESKGKMLRVLDPDPVVTVSETDLYMVRYGHEVRLTFGANPLEQSKGPLEIAVRKLEKGAEVQRVSGTYDHEQNRGAKVELPGGIGGLRIEFREGRAPDAGGSGKRGPIRQTLYDYKTLKQFPDRMRQPASLEIKPGEEGAFNLPRR